MSRTNGKPTIEIFVTADFLDEEDYRAVKDQLQPHVRVGGGLAYEFSEVEVAHVVVELLANVVQSVPLNFFSSYLYDAFKDRFLKPRGADKTLFEFKLKDGEKYTYASLETSDSEVLKEAMATFRDLASPQSKFGSFEFDGRTRRWKRR